MRNYPDISTKILFITLISCSTTSWAGAANTDDPAKLVKASLHTDRTVVQIGQHIWVNFLLSNLTSDAVSLVVPESTSVIYNKQNVPPGKQVQGEMGLPLAHVFSGKGHSALSIENNRHESLDIQVTLQPQSPSTEVVLAPHGSVGLRVELTQYYETLMRPGKYKLVWKPYDGLIESSPLTITVLSEQQAVMVTDFGNIVIRFYYDQAPNHVNNFLELVKERFYDELTFHRVIPGGIIQGGCPRGDGYGVRKDGKRLKAEFNNIPFSTGTVGMARSSSDPDSASCQFYICLSRQPTFDGQQTAFGHIVGDPSFNTLSKIASVPTDSKDRPQRPVYIRSISLENVPLRERTEPDRPPSGASIGRRSEDSPSRKTIRPMPPETKDRGRLDLSAVRKPISSATTKPANKIEP
ncbi:MAG: peptidylprolyl isomerase [Planctomycetota bacterium]|nr:MAG: peptidylprolyl isomerase [Planctomycetota bacterium]